MITYKMQNNIEKEYLGNNRPCEIYLNYPCSIEGKTFFVHFVDDKSENVEEIERLTSTLQLYVVSFCVCFP